MGRLTTLWQSIKIEYISVAGIEETGLMKVGGTVVNSNFLPEGRRSLMPVFAEKTSEVLSIGDLIKVTLFTPKGENQVTEDEDGTKRSLVFKDCGTKYELWNEEAGGWDKIYEIFRS